MRTELFADRVYVLTPKGEVIDLPRGATPLDFAYSVHTSLGHRCRGAKGERAHRAPHTRARQRGDCRGHHRQARRTESRLARTRAGLPDFGAQSRKVRAWFRKQDVGDNRSAGLRIAERELGAHRRAPRTAQRPGAGAQGTRQPITCISCLARARSP